MHPWTAATAAAIIVVAIADEKTFWSSVKPRLPYSSIPAVGGAAVDIIPKAVAVAVR
jgi:hypothetical protein